ncbi:MAG: hypothetical protein K6G15_09145 [Desulfovibrio sp.]|nr:hypothetical protein [Desulfovibrio sp.]
MMKPFYQGKIDTFCALYAVLNALRLTHSIRTLKARELFNDMLMVLVGQPERFRAVLEQTTDYIDLVDEMLQYAASRMPLRIQRPFQPEETVSRERFWDCCEHWVNGQANRTAIFRFKRYLNPSAQPSVRHWTTIARIDSNSLDLYDSSHEADSIQHLAKNHIVTDKEQISQNILLYVQPDTLRLVGLPF